MSIIKVENLYTKYNDVIIHNGISFDVKKGEIFGILGGSGSGKSTLLKKYALFGEANERFNHIFW